MASYKKLFWLAVAVLLLGGGYYLSQNYKAVRLTPEAIKANPSLLNGATMKGGEFKGLVLKDVTLTGTKFTEIRLQDPVFENVTFVDAKFDEMDMNDVRFTNVRFNNCTFINAHMRDGEFADVIFSGGSFSYRGDPLNYYNPSYIMGMKLINVVLDGVQTDNFRMEAVTGSITAKNLTNIKRRQHSGSLISGYRLILRVDNCEADGFPFAGLSDNSTAYVTNSTFKISGFIGEKSKAMYFENCKILDGSNIVDAETLVVKNSTVCAVFEGRGTWYLEGCEFVPDPTGFTTGFLGKKDSRCFVFGSKSKALEIGLMGGTIYLFDMILERPMFYPNNPVTAINLRNVTIHGGKFENFLMKGGQWENVQMYPEVTIGNTDLGDLKTHNLTFPAGNPWRGEGKVITTQTSKPFDWPEVHVPTPAELGLKDTLQ